MGWLTRVGRTQAVSGPATSRSQEGRPQLHDQRCQHAVLRPPRAPSRFVPEAITSPATGEGHLLRTGHRVSPWQLRGQQGKATTDLPCACVSGVLFKCLRHCARHDLGASRAPKEQPLVLSLPEAQLLPPTSRGIGVTSSNHTAFYQLRPVGFCAVL